MRGLDRVAVAARRIGAQIEQATPQDLAEIEALLAANHLPIAGVKDWMESALVARASSRTIGCAALEVYPSGVLLRSVAVDSVWRGRGVGGRLTDAGLALARNHGAEAGCRRQFPKLAGLKVFKDMNLARCVE